MAATSPADPLTVAWLGAFLERYLAAWNGHDADAMVPLVTADVVWDDPALPAPARGVAELQEFMRTSWRAFGDLAFETPEQHLATVEGERATFTWRMRGTHTGALDPPGFAATGRTIDVTGVDIVRIREGRIADYRAFYDVQGLSRQLGLVPAPGSGGERALVALQRAGARLRR